MSNGLRDNAAGRGSGLPAPYAKLLDTLERLDEYSHRALVNFPRYERALLCAEIRGCLIQIRRLTVTAHKRFHKKTTLGNLDIEKEVLSSMIKKAQLVRYISIGQRLEWQEIVNTLGRQIGAWIKHANLK